MSSRCSRHSRHGVAQRRDAGGWLEYARLMAQTGVDALVLFNRFYQPDIDAEELSATRTRTSRIPRNCAFA